MKVKWDPEGQGYEVIILREEWALEKARKGRIMNVAEAEVEKLGLHSVYNVHDEPAREFKPHLTQSGQA